MLAVCQERLTAAGFARYEISAYAAAGRQCRHNRNYWSFGDYLGIGAGAHGKITSAAAGQIVRTAQAREPRRYLASTRDGTLTRTVVPVAELPFEFMLNALRLVAGFEIGTYTGRTGLPWQTVAATMTELVAEGLILAADACYCASPLGLRFLNDVLLRFVTEIPKTAGQSELSTAPQPPPALGARALYTGVGGGNVK